MRLPPRIRRLARVTGIVLGTIVGIVVVACLLLLVRPVREDVLDHVLRVASDSLPGSIDYEEASWPSLSQLELRAVTWRDGDTLLVAADRLALEADLGALLQKDLHVRLLAIEGAQADLPRIREVLPPPDPEPGTDDDGAPPAFPRAGALPAIPSVAIDSLDVDVTRLQVAEDVTLTARLSLSLDLLAGHTPVLALRSLDGAWLEQDWTVLSPGVELALASGEFDGRIDADLPPRAALRMDFESPSPQAFRIVLAERDATAPLLQVDGTFTQSDRGAPESVTYAFVFDAPELARIEQALQRPGSLVSLQPLGRVQARGNGALSLSDPVGGELELAVTLEGIAGRLDGKLRHEPGWIGIERLDAVADGLRVEAAGEYATGTYKGTAQVDVEGVRFLAAWPFAESIPQDLRAHLELEAGGEGAALRPALLLTGAAPSAGLDSLHVAGYGRIDGPDSDLRVDLRALLREQLALALDVRVVDLERPRLHVAPIRVRGQLEDLSGASVTLPADPNVQVDPTAKSLVVEDLRVTGDLGELRLDADLSQSEGGSGRLLIEWPRPPAALGLAGFDAAARDTLLAPVWSQDGRPGIDARVEVRAGAGSGTLDAEIVLPAPWSVIAGLEPAAYDAPHLRGSARAEWDDARTWTAALDFAATAWLDSAFAHAHGEAGTAHLDSMLVRGGPVRATAAGALDSTTVDGKFQLELVAHPALSLVVPDLPEDLQFMANLRAGIAGSVEAPDARAKLLASARSPSLRLPLLTVEAEVVEGIPQSAVIDIPERARLGGLNVERAQLALRPEDPREGLFPLWFASEVLGDVYWAQVARIDSTGGMWTVATDSLGLGAGGHVLRSQQPFTFATTPADSTIRLEGLSLAGDPGMVSASLDLGPGRARADVEMHLDASIPGALVRMPARMLPTGYHLVARGNQDDLEASLRVEGINLGTRQDIVASVESRRSGDRVEIDVLARDELGRLAHGDVVLPMTVDLLSRSFAWHSGPLTGSVEVDSLPLPYRVGGGEGFGSYLLGARDASAPLADARLLFGGTGDQPVVGARIGVGFPQIEKLQDARLQLSALWTGPEGEPATLELFRPEILTRIDEALPHGGIAVLGSLDREGRSQATLGAVFPLAEGSASPIPGFGPEDPFEFGVSAQPLRLDEWESVLQRGARLGGEVWIQANAEGQLGDFPLEASVRMEDLFLRQSFGTSATLDGEIDISGRSTAPVIRGTIRVPNALVRLPDSGRDLHPVDGGSKLWNIGLIPRDEFAALDSLEVEWGWAFDVEDSTQADEPMLTLAESTDLDVKVEIPNSFWIRGQGLEVQLAGELHLELRNGVPTAVGELRALSGTLEVVGARLQLDRGVVAFYGGDTTNPALDLELSRSQGDVRVIVRVTGTALEPRLTFDSDPPMSQSDIMSYLLFGSSADDLDGAQTQLLQDQAAAALSQFAAPMLENELTQSLGISMMQLQAGEDPDDGLSLVVGKYVTPQILLKYEQSLKDRQKYTVNAEYWLTRNLRIETRLSETRSTGIELNWSTDY